MTDERKSGIALIAGSLGGVLTMAIHPTSAAGALTTETAGHLAIVSGAAHSLAMGSVVLLFLGACGLTRTTNATDRLSFTALVTFGFACVAVMVAAAVSGFIVPEIAQRMVRDISAAAPQVPAAARQWQIVVTGIFQINQAFARIYSVAASLAIILWSVSTLRNGGFSRGVAIYGCIISPLIVIGIGMGHLRLDVHGMAAVMLSHAIWFILVGYQLWSRRASS